MQIQGELEAIDQELGIELGIRPVAKEKHPLFSLTIQAEIILKGKVIGIIGQIAQTIQERFALKKEVTIAQFDCDSLTLAANKNKKYTSIPKYPPIVEDYTFYNQNQVSAAKIVEVGKQVDLIIQSVNVLGFYQDKINLEVVYLHKKKNLTDQDVAPIRRKFVSAIEKLGMKLEGEV